VNGQDLNPGQKGDEILYSIFHFAVEEIFGKEKDELVKGSILNVPLSHKNKKYSSLSCTIVNPVVEAVECPGMIMVIME
ncbi:unnamed protein product, partial [Brachionus calyciflorus]